LSHDSIESLFEIIVLDWIRGEIMDEIHFFGSVKEKGSGITGASSPFCGEKCSGFGEKPFIINFGQRCKLLSNLRSLFLTPVSK
jgi:hypothetical protein